MPSTTIRRIASISASPGAAFSISVFERIMCFGRGHRPHGVVSHQENGVGPNLRLEPRFWAAMVGAAVWLT
jgi:hypothetical protein